MSTSPDTCPQCGARLFPVLDETSPRPASALVPADPPFRLGCSTCPPPVAPPLGPG